MTGLTKTMIMGLEIRDRSEVHLREPCMGMVVDYKEGVWAESLIW